MFFDLVTCLNAKLQKNIDMRLMFHNIFTGCQPQKYHIVGSTLHTTFILSGQCSIGGDRIFFSVHHAIRCRSVPLLIQQDVGHR